MKIAISYRRAESAGIAGRVFDRVIARYGPDSAFIDIENIPYGTDFRQHLRNTLKETDVHLALIGSDWLGKRGQTTARIMMPDDPVRIEIEIALENNVPIIPVLIGSSRMPEQTELPPSISALAFLNAASLDVGRDFHVHISRLFATVDSLLRKKFGALTAKSNDRRERYKKIPKAEYLFTYRTWVTPAICGLILLLLPLGAAIESFSPPWPSGVSVISYCVVILMGTIAYELSKHFQLQRISLLMISCAVLAGLCATLYFAGIAYYTYKQPGSHGLWAKGFVCTPEATQLYKDKCPDLGLDELSGAEFHEDRLWTSESIAAVKYLLALLWFIMFGSLSVLVAGVLAKRAAEFVVGSE